MKDTVRIRRALDNVKNDIYGDRGSHWVFLERTVNGINYSTYPMRIYPSYLRRWFKLNMCTLNKKINIKLK